MDSDLMRWVKAQADDQNANPRFRELLAALEAAQEDVADAMGALRVAVLALAHASECNPVYMPAYIHVSAAIDQARGEGEP